MILIVYKQMWFKKINYSLLWSGLERFSSQIIQFITTIILARLLQPSDFGIIAICTTIIYLFQTINESGFTFAIIQKNNRTIRDLNTIYSINIIFSISSFIIIYLFAPSIGNIFGNSNLSTVIRILSISLIINSFNIVQSALILINADFKNQAKFSIFSILISGTVGIVLAYLNYEVYSIVFQNLICSTIYTILIFKHVKYRPRFVFNICSYKYILSFSLKLSTARFIDALYQSILPIIIGKIYSIKELGLFNRAQSFISISSNNFTSIIQKVSTPILCKYNNNLNKLEYSYLLYLFIASSIVFPITIILFIFSKEIIIILLTDKWSFSSIYLRYLCPVGILYVLNTFNRNLISAVGKVNVLLKLEIIKKSINIVSIIFALKFSLEFLLVINIITSIIELLISAYFSKKFTGISLYKQLTKIRPVILSSLITVLLGITINNILFFDNDYLKILLTCFLYIVIFLILFKNADYKHFLANRYNSN